jgi:hypothetical protein
MTLCLLLWATHNRWSFLRDVLLCECVCFVCACCIVYVCVCVCVYGAEMAMVDGM